MTKVQKGRLEKLANHLISGELGHDKFDMARFSTGKRKGPGENDCGTVGCALGECPVIFPRSWKFQLYGDDFEVSPVLRKSYFLSAPFLDADRFFGLVYGACMEADLLFGVGAQNFPWGGKRPSQPSRETVGKYILAFLDWVEKGRPDPGPDYIQFYV